MWIVSVWVGGLCVGDGMWIVGVGLLVYDCWCRAVSVGKVDGLCDCPDA